MLVRSSRKEECRAAVFVVVVVVAGAGCCCWHTGSGNKGVKRDRGERRRRDYKERGKGGRRGGGERQRERERGWGRLETDQSEVGESRSSFAGGRAGKRDNGRVGSTRKELGGC